MSHIKKNIIEGKNITVFSVHGIFNFDQIINEIDRLHASDHTLHALWDFTNADLSAIEESHIKRIIEHTRKYTNLRKGGKSAILVSRDLGYGMARMYDTYAELKSILVKYNVFRDINEAMNWIEK